MDQTKEIDLRILIGVIVKKLWLIVLCAVIAGTAVYLYTANFVKPQYRASVSIYVNNAVHQQGTPGISASDLSASQRLVTTYVNILKSDTVLDKVAQEAGVKMSAEKIRSMMTAESLEETEVFRVQISATDPELAADIANAVATVAPTEIAKIVEGSSTKIIDYAKVPKTPYSPNKVQNTIIGAFAGVVLVVLVLALQVLLDVRVKDEADLERISSAPVLGTIPSFFAEGSKENDYKSEAQNRAVSK